MLTSIFAIAAAILGFLGGSLWLFSAAIGFLIIKMYPIVLVAIVLSAGMLLAFRYWWRRRQR